MLNMIDSSPRINSNFAPQHFSRIPPLSVPHGSEGSGEHSTSNPRESSAVLKQRHAPSLPRAVSCVRRLVQAAELDFGVFHLVRGAAFRARGDGIFWGARSRWLSSGGI